jgi:hypothetical protein
MGCKPQPNDKQAPLQAQQTSKPVLSPRLEEEAVTKVLQIRYTDDEELNNAITFDEDLNKLQASLLRSRIHLILMISETDSR